MTRWILGGTAVVLLVSQAITGDDGNAKGKLISTLHDAHGRIFADDPSSIKELFHAIPGDLKFQQIWATYGPHGPQRSDLKTPLKSYPGDDVSFHFAVHGLNTDDDGNVKAEIVTRLQDADGKVLVNDHAPIKGLLPLGGKQMVGTSTVKFSPELPQGDYTYTITVVDELANQKSSCDCKIKMLKPEFCMVGLHFFLDAEGKVSAPGTLAAGQALHFRFQAVGFDRSAKRLKMVMLFEPLNEKGKALIPKPSRVEIASNDEQQVASATSVNFNGEMAMNRPGSYRISITVKDEVNAKELKVEVPINVVE